MIIETDLNQLIQIFPDYIKRDLEANTRHNELIEIVMDVGRRPEARFLVGSEYLSDRIVSWQDIDYATKRVRKFNDDNRAGIERTLHRISCMRNRDGLIVGLTCRVGRSIIGTISIIRDLLESGQSLLILGRPGVGKTTVIREISRVLSDELGKRVIIIDTSNEIAGDSDIPHPSIGRARRMQVSHSEQQHRVMIEAVENHMPEVIIVDEIGTELETLAARTIAERGVQLVGTIHGNSLDSLIKNPILSDLIGGIQPVTLGDEEARRRGTKKSILERKSLPTFQIAIELNSKNQWTIHQNVEKSVDEILLGQTPKTEIRMKNNFNQIKIEFNNFLVPENQFGLDMSPNPTQFTLATNTLVAKSENMEKENLNNTLSSTLFIYAFSISKIKIEKICHSLQSNFVITTDIKEANLILAIKSSLKENPKIIQVAKRYKIPIYAVNNNSIGQITKIIKCLLRDGISSKNTS